MDTKLTFHVYHKDVFLRTQTTDQSIVKIGRLPSSPLFLDDPDIARMHAVIEIGPEETYVVDLGSMVGTAVNGRKVNKAKLNHNDEIRFGPMCLIIQFGEGTAAPAVPKLPEAPKPPEPRRTETISSVVAPNQSHQQTIEMIAIGLAMVQAAHKAIPKKGPTKDIATKAHNSAVIALYSMLLSSMQKGLSLKPSTLEKIAALIVKEES